MRIGIEAQRIFRTKKHGMDMVALELVRNLQKIDHTHEYFVFIKSDKDICLKETENFKLIVTPSAPYPIWEQMMLPYYSGKYKLDLLHCTSNTAPVFPRTKLILTLHDVIFLENTPNQNKNSYQVWGNRYRKMIVPKVLKKTDQVITVSKFEQQRITEKIKFKHDIKYVYNGLGEHFKHHVSQNALINFKQMYQLPENYILFFGNTDPKKNVKNTLLAYKKYCESKKKPLPLVMLDYNKESLQQLSREINIQSCIQQIVLPGYIPNSELPKLYRNAEIFLYPSLRESFGIPILESFASGIPVLTSNTSSMPEIAGDAAIFTDPASPEDIFQKMLLLLNDRSLRKNLIDKGNRRVKDFSWKKMAENVKEIYEQTLKN